jgi:hypothetical protein
MRRRIHACDMRRRIHAYCSKCIYCVLEWCRCSVRDLRNTLGIHWEHIRNTHLNDVAALYETWGTHEEHTLEWCGSSAVHLGYRDDKVCILLLTWHAYILLLYWHI